MKNLIPILKYFGLFIAIYAALFSLASMSSVATAINNAYRTVSEPMLQSIFPKAYLELEADAPPESDPNTFRAVFTSKTKIEAAKAAARQKGSSKVDLKATEYDIYLNLLFTSFWLFLVTLILITPIGLRQKLVALVVGSILFFAYTFFKVFIFLLDLFNRSSFDMYKLSERGGNFVESISYVVKSLGMSAFVVIFIWILVAFRKSNWREMLGKLGG